MHHAPDGDDDAEQAGPLGTACFFLADVAPHPVQTVAKRLADEDIHVEPLDDLHLGESDLRMTTGRPEGGKTVPGALEAIP